MARMEIDLIVQLNDISQTLPRRRIMDKNNGCAIHVIPNESNADCCSSCTGVLISVILLK